MLVSISTGLRTSKYTGSEQPGVVPIHCPTGRSTGFHLMVLRNICPRAIVFRQSSSLWYVRHRRRSRSLTQQLHLCIKPRNFRQNPRSFEREAIAGCPSFTGPQTRHERRLGQALGQITYAVDDACVLIACSILISIGASTGIARREKLERACLIRVVSRESTISVSLITPLATRGHHTRPEVPHLSRARRDTSTRGRISLRSVSLPP